jgi:hypothetical protein
MIVVDIKKCLLHLGLGFLSLNYNSLCFEQAELLFVRPCEAFDSLIKWLLYLELFSDALDTAGLYCLCFFVKGDDHPDPSHQDIAVYQVWMGDKSALVDDKRCLSRLLHVPFAFCAESLDHHSFAKSTFLKVAVIEVLVSFDEAISMRRLHHLIFRCLQCHTILIAFFLWATQRDSSFVTTS